MKFPPEFTRLLARAMGTTGAFQASNEANRFVIRIESFTWLQAAAIPPKISSCGINPFFLPTLKIIEL